MLAQIHDQAKRAKTVAKLLTPAGVLALCFGKTWQLKMVDVLRKRLAYVWQQIILFQQPLRASSAT